MSGIVSVPNKRGEFLWATNSRGFESLLADARVHLDDPLDVAELESAEVVKGLSLDDYDAGQAARIANGLLLGATTPAPNSFHRAHLVRALTGWTPAPKRPPWRGITVPGAGWASYAGQTWLLPEEVTRSIVAHAAGSIRDLPIRRRLLGGDLSLYHYDDAPVAWAALMIIAGEVFDDFRKDAQRVPALNEEASETLEEMVASLRANFRCPYVRTVHADAYDQPPVPSGDPPPGARAYDAMGGQLLASKPFWPTFCGQIDRKAALWHKTILDLRYTTYEMTKAVYDHVGRMAPETRTHVDVLFPERWT